MQDRMEDFQAVSDTIEALFSKTSSCIETHQDCIDRFKERVSNANNWDVASEIKNNGTSIINAVAMIGMYEELQKILTHSDDATITYANLRGKLRVVQNLLMQSYQFVTANDPFDQAKKEARFALVELLSEALI